MNYRMIGSTGIEVSEVSLGCMTMGGLKMEQHLPDVDEDAAIAGIQAGLDGGVNHFDNADVYGLGDSERLLAKGLGDRSKDVVITSKVGHYPGTAAHAYDPIHIRNQCETSLRNLNRDVLDIYYFHHGNFGPDDVYLDDAVEAMNQLKEQGKIRAVGLSAYSDDDFLRLVPTIKPAVLQSWASIGDNGFIREGSPVSNLMVENDIWFVAFNPLKSGLLVGAFDAANPAEKFKNRDLADMSQKLDALKVRFGSTSSDLARVALQYNVRHPNVACSICGFRNGEQVASNLGGSHDPLSEEDVAFIQGVFSDQGV